MAERKETRFNPETYTHVLPEGVPDFDDYMEEDLQQDPELGLTDEEVAAEVAKLSEEDKKLYEQIKTFMDSFYRQHGYIIPITDLIQVTHDKEVPRISHSDCRITGGAEARATPGSEEEKGIRGGQCGGGTTPQSEVHPN